MKKLTQEDIIQRIKEVHGDTFDLSRIKYTNKRTKIELVCKEHGSWFTLTERLYIGNGCPKCGKIKSGLKNRIKFEDFVLKANQVHSFKYQYFKDSYTKLSAKTKIKCPEHGFFYQLAGMHTRERQGCPKCGLIAIGGKKRMSLDDFIRRSNKVHSNKYDYSKVNYKRNNKKVIIVCPIHGEFKQEPQNHLNGSSCPYCATIESHNLQRKSTEDFIKDSIKVHGDRYDYSKVNYIDVTTHVEIICKKHGKFLQTPNTHQGGAGCPNCNISRGEELIKQILIKHNIEYFQQKTFRGLRDVGKLKCDFYLPLFNLVIEFNGRQHYEVVKAFGGEKGFIDTQRRDKIKREFLYKKNIKLLEIHYQEENVEKIISEFIFQINTKN